ncbi:MAG: M23 family metallopeptidase [Spongiibacteraceae bacterium]
MTIHRIADRLKMLPFPTVSRWTRALLSLCVFGLPLGAGLAVGYALGCNQADAAGNNPAPDDGARLQSLAQRMAELEARLGRLDALGERVADAAQVESVEPTAKSPAIGGPASDAGEVPSSEDVYAAIDRLTRAIDDRESQFDNFQEMLANRKVGDRALYGAMPVHRGELSSYFGMRVDPFTGRRSMHQGIDFSGRPGTAILAAADGVVTFAGNKGDYGRAVEINHGEDCFTRYAHSKLIFVKQGDVVKKGQVIALMGNSGRTTGTHLHFEVYKHGRPVDPYIYLAQVSR